VVIGGDDADLNLSRAWQGWPFGQRFDLFWSWAPLGEQGQGPAVASVAPGCTLRGFVPGRRDGRGWVRSGSATSWSSARLSWGRASTAGPWGEWWLP